MAKVHLHCLASEGNFSLAVRIDYAKEKLGCSTVDIIGLLEVLDEIQNQIPDCTLSERQYFLETIDDLVTLAKERLDKFREATTKLEVWQ